jgi:Kef-type K+ transport system membrane component KefB
VARRRALPYGLTYLALVGLPVMGLIGVLRLGRGLRAPSGSAAEWAPSGVASAQAAAPPGLALLIVQIVVILVVARLMGRAMRALGQPQVVGEMAAGILLGPSVLGAWAPAISASLFPPASLAILSSLSQIGLILFMFLVGLELDLGALRERGQTALLTSHAGITTPFLLGTALSLFLYPRLASDRVTFTGFALFMGAAMSVTAFPVLARILTERRMLGTRLGALAITCAAVDDVTAWCILAAVVVLVRLGESTVPLWLTLAGSALFCAAMLGVGRPGLRKLEAAYRARGLTQDLVGLVVLLVLGSAWITEALGIHALFGAFLAGVCMPRNPGLLHALLNRFQDLMVVLLVPLFFAFSGLRTSIGLIQGSEAWAVCGVIVAIAIAGKLGGCAVAAGLTGMPWREATALGVLMNTRGLMELVILNIGLDVGAISPPLFTMMVLMALVTTFMTTPLVKALVPGPAEGGRSSWVSATDTQVSDPRR